MKVAYTKTVLSCAFYFLICKFVNLCIFWSVVLDNPSWKLNRGILGLSTLISWKNGPFDKFLRVCKVIGKSSRFLMCRSSARDPEPTRLTEDLYGRLCTCLTASWTSVERSDHHPVESVILVEVRNVQITNVQFTFRCIYCKDSSYSDNEKKCWFVCGLALIDVNEIL